MCVRQPVRRVAPSSASIAAHLRVRRPGGQEVGVLAAVRGWRGGDHRRVLGVRDQQTAEAGDLGHRRGQLCRVQQREFVHPGRQQEALEAGHPGLVQRPQVGHVPGHRATPERHVHRELAGRRGSFLPQGGHGHGGRDAVQRHIHDRGHPARRGGRGRGAEPFPLGAARFVHVHVAVHQAGQQHVTVRQGDRTVRRRGVVSQPGHQPVPDEHGGRPLAAWCAHPPRPDRRHLHPPSRHPIGAHIISAVSYAPPAGQKSPR